MIYPHLITVKTRPLIPPQDDLDQVMLEYLPPLLEKDILVVTSKVVAISQGRCVAISEVSNKEELVVAEAQAYIPKASSQYNITLSIKENTLIAASGIDESNGKNHYILWPTESSLWAQRTCLMLKKRFDLKELGIIVTDSHCTPMRWGVTGISIGFFGFQPLIDYRGKPDIFGRELHFSQGNTPDAVAAAAVGVMGEADECTPLVIARNWPRVTFVDYPTHDGFQIAPAEDIFAPLLKIFTAVKHGS